MDYRLLVEGPDDKHVIRHLLKSRGLDLAEKQVQDMDGIFKLLDDLPAYLKSSERAVGVIIDADLDASSRWQSVADHVRKAGYENVPKEPQAAGTILEAQDKPRLGVWLMPNNELPGAIEEFVKLLIPDGDEVWPHAREFVAALPENLCRFRPQDTPKAEIHTWLAVQDEPGSRMGAAITKRYLDGTSARADAFVAFIQQLAR